MDVNSFASNVQCVSIHGPYEVWSCFCFFTCECPKPLLGVNQSVNVALCLRCFMIIYSWRCHIIQKMFGRSLLTANGSSRVLQHTSEVTVYFKWWQAKSYVQTYNEKLWMWIPGCTDAKDTKRYPSSPVISAQLGILVKATLWCLLLQ